MPMKEYNKLVRDNILDILKEKNVKNTYHVAKTKKEFLEKLYEKFIEEFEEFKANPCVEEYADILEVLESIGKLYNFDLTEVKMTKILEECKLAVENEIREECREEAMQILKKSTKEVRMEFLKYHKKNQGNICCLVLDFAKQELIKSGKLEQKESDCFKDPYT